MKKILSVLLSVLMLAGSFSAYAMTDKEAMDRATSFGWVDGGHENTEKITRADLARMLVKFGGITSAGDTSSSFSDISSGDERLAYINAVTERGIMSAYLNGNFDPDGIVTLQQATKAVLVLLGYGSWAEAAGGYPNGYLAVASGTDIFDGVGGNVTSPMTYASIARLLSNASTIPLCEPAMENGTVVYVKNENKTILTEVHDASSVKGRIIANDITSLNGEYTPVGYIKLKTKNGTVMQMQDGGLDLSQYIGCNATVYYKTVDGTDIVAYIIPDSNTEELTISSSDIERFEDGVYTYAVDGKTKRARVAKDADVIYNGKLVDDISSFTDVSYMYFPRYSNNVEKDGKIRLVSTDGSSSYDLVFIDVMECYAVDHYSEANETIYLKDNKPSFDVEDEDTYDIFDVNGDRVELSALAEWDIIEEYKSIDGKYSRYVIVRDTVEGTVDSIRTGIEEHGSITIDGVEYPYDDNGDISLGTKGIFLLSSTGRVIMMTDEVLHSVSFGYVIKAYGEDYEDSCHVKLLTMDGEIAEYESASKVKYDGESVQAATLKNIANEKMLDRTLVTYELNESGKIKSIDTPKENKTKTPSDLRLLYSNMPNSSATEHEKNSGLIFKKNLNCFGGKIIVTSSTTMLSVPDSGSSFDSYTIKDTSGLRNDGNYKNLAAYTLGTNSQKALIIVQEIAGGIDTDFGDDSNFAVVDKIVTGINPMGEEAQCMRVYMNGSIKEVYGEDLNTFVKYEAGKTYPLKKGDIVRYTVNSSGVVSGWKQVSGSYVSGLDPLYVQSYGALEIPSTFENNVFGSSSRFGCYIYDKVDSFVGVALKSNLASVAPENGDVVYFNSDKANVYIYDKARDKVEVGTVDDLETYKSVGSDCSKVYLSAFKGEILDVVIYK